ncbi:MAG: hypothetical protein ACM3U2_02125 [Deltaproteobacteria bacterium]
MRTSRCLVGGILAALATSVSLGQERPADNVFGLPEGAAKKTGSLVIAGGGDLPDAVYDEFVRIAGGKKARLAYLAHVLKKIGDFRLPTRQIPAVFCSGSRQSGV